ncbi:site-specific integrase [Myroides marinus]|uniref:site-specific integrase n=1 Tax=Myroides marinus TaxID=703342 RepID=UPI00257846C4|nr:site-specific integrase [Myroides marinus]MDM1352070.1 site-specific integrase [Myroides marinus]MDM1359244.1 site-specific integrase [Myroides marinus]
MIGERLSINFFLKTPRKITEGDYRRLYLRITIDGVRRELSLNRKCKAKLWDQKQGRAIGNSEETKTLNFFLDSIMSNITNYRADLISSDIRITPKIFVDFIKGYDIRIATVLQEFQEHNEQVFKLVPKEYAMGTYERYVTAMSHIKEFILREYNKSDLNFRDLDYNFIIGYEQYLKNIRGCNKNTAIKYIGNFKKIVFRALAKGIISKDPFAHYKPRKEKLNKRPLTNSELQNLEQTVFPTKRLEEVRDIFIFQCYTGLAYIDVFKLKNCDIHVELDNTLWIRINRHKTNSILNIPLLPRAIEIINKYKTSIDFQRSVLPVKSNQKMNVALKEIGSICGINNELNTHMARRTFASTITLANGVPIHIVKELLGHYSVKQTEEYAITEEKSIGIEMKKLENVISVSKSKNKKKSKQKRMIKKLDKVEKKLSKLTISDKDVVLYKKISTLLRSLRRL